MGETIPQQILQYTDAIATRQEPKNSANKAIGNVMQFTNSAGVNGALLGTTASADKIAAIVPITRPAKRTLGFITYHTSVLVKRSAHKTAGITERT